MRKFITTILITALVIVFAGCQASGQSSDTIELKLAHNQTLDHPVHARYSLVCSCGDYHE